ncbi:NADH-quinone oxidoreductase subunit J [Candidatus Bathyarchaeota archaeon]|jgi:NADH-quinone oxidoreductase subunit J|nr:NADH-quinone oxidoreductase subunit J [Candidatus Bathyarchaeota archaeon]MCK4702542.1 NADH-quinone oxidoreductase subunit J [Candidatus Bathyarchaeota archaeon]
MIALIIVLTVVVVTAFLAVVSRNIVYGVVFLLCSNVALGIVYYMMSAPTAALFQFAIFSGAIVVFFLITVMLTQAGQTRFDDEEVSA